MSTDPIEEDAPLVFVVYDDKSMREAILGAMVASLHPSATCSLKCSQGGTFT